MRFVCGLRLSHRPPLSANQPLYLDKLEQVFYIKASVFFACFVAL
jgi:hypothetical protein